MTRPNKAKKKNKWDAATYFMIWPLSQLSQVEFQIPCKYFRKYSFAHFFSDLAIYSTRVSWRPTMCQVCLWCERRQTPFLSSQPFQSTASASHMVAEAHQGRASLAPGRCSPGCGASPVRAGVLHQVGALGQWAFSTTVLGSPDGQLWTLNKLLLK